METLMTAEQVAAQIQISDKTLRKWRWEGKGPRYVKVGRKVAYRPADVEAFVQANLRASTSDMGGLRHGA